MHKTMIVLATVLGLLCPVLFPLEARGHGEVDEDQLAAFQNHLDEYGQEIRMLVQDVKNIVEDYGAGENVAPKIQAWIDQWEEVGVHAAIESRATVTYPGIWQTIVALQQAVEADEPDGAVAAAGEAVEAALWQGMGAVRLAASQVGREAPADTTTPTASGPETIEAIVADLEEAVAAYRADDLQRAEALIHETYMSRFEGLEGDLIERDPDLVSGLEKDFNATLPLLMQQGAPVEKVRARLDAMKGELDRASRLLEQAAQSRSEVF